MGDANRPDWPGRLRRAWRTPPADVRAVVVSTPSNIKYLTGFDGSAGLFLTTPDRHWLIVDGRYTESARRSQADGRLADVQVATISSSFDAGLIQLLAAEVPTGSIGFESSHVTVATLRRWERDAAPRRFEATLDWVERLRAVKDDAELALIRHSCLTLSSVARELGRWVREGRTEREVGLDIDDAMRRAGMTRPAFETIVASGPNSALPHARPTDRRLRQGDLVVLDFGGVLDGYCGDLTRMAGVGEVGGEARALFDAVRAAQVAALAAVRAQVLVSEVDRAARQVLTTHGFGEAFVHSTGHGIGLDVHEAPRIGRRTEGSESERLMAGMVCTIEPGAYVASVGGVRLEDDVVVTNEGCEVLTDVPRDLLIV